MARKETAAMIRFLQQVRDTGRTAGKWAVYDAAVRRGLFERDRVEGYAVYSRLTEAGSKVLDAAS